MAEDKDDTGGLYAVYDKDVRQYVSGVGTKANADDARGRLGKTGVTKGHKLETRRVN
jgi:hypothetical protein